jgi:exopolysaccharide production protein ExoZ
MSGVSRTGSERIASIQVLRCVAATLVVLYHTDLQVLRLTDGQHIHAFGFAAAGTDLLFVISGFIMVYITREAPIGFGEFLFRRVARIAPLYWLCTLVMLVAYFALPGLFHTTSFDVWHYLASLAFVPYPHPVLGIQRPFLFPGWALNYFVFFYILFGLCLALSVTRRIVAVSLVLVALVAAWAVFRESSPLLDFYGAPIMLDFVVGMIAAWIFLNVRFKGVLPITIVAAASAVIFAAGIAAGASGGHERFFYWGLADAGLLFSVVSAEREWGGWGVGPVAQLGEASFAIYITNLFTLALVTKAVHVTGLMPVLGMAGVQLLMIAAALGAGLLVSLLIERPLQAFTLRHGLRWFEHLRSPAPAPMADR